MTLKTIPVRAEVALTTVHKTYVAGPKKKATMTVYGDVPGEIVMRTAVANGAESDYDAVSHLVLDTEAAQALCLELLERLGPFPALLDRLGVADSDLRVGPGTLHDGEGYNTLAESQERAKPPVSDAWELKIETYVVSKDKGRVEYGFTAKRGEDSLFDIVLGECKAEDAQELSKASWEEFAWVRDALRVATGWGQEIIVHGNVSDGFSFIGPFLHGQAVPYAEQRIRDDWHVTELLVPTYDPPSD